MIYAGIGSRDTPDDICITMTKLARVLSDLGYTLRSGGAAGADKAFAAGASDKEIFRPNDATAEAIELSSKYHPAWNRCKQWAKLLHARNAQIVLGRELNSPVSFVICWTKNAKGTGGTGQGIRIAKGYNIPVYDLGNPNILRMVENIITTGVLKWE